MHMTPPTEVPLSEADLAAGVVQRLPNSGWVELPRLRQLGY